MSGERDDEPTDEERANGWDAALLAAYRTERARVAGEIVLGPRRPLPPQRDPRTLLRWRKGRL